MERLRTAFVAAAALVAACGPLDAERGSAADDAKLRGIGEFFRDAAVTTKVKVALAASVGAARAARIEVDTRRAVVTLTGEVDTRDVRVRADQAAIGVDGVRSVVDNIVVRFPAIG
jgi:osmotically-inducible protein OsmY